MANTFTGLKLQGQIGKFGAKELSDIEGQCWVIHSCNKLLNSRKKGNGCIVKMVIWFVALKFTNTSWALLWLVGTQYYYWPDRIRWNFQGFLTRTMQHLEPRFIATLLLGPLYFGLNENSVSQLTPLIWPSINMGRFLWPIGDKFTRVSL